MATQQIPKAAAKHIERLPLEADGTVTECVILKRYPNGDRMFLRIDQMDEIDKQRLRYYISLPHAMHLELWDLMSQQRLGNGMNALEFFHQMARYWVASSRKIIMPNLSTTGSSMPAGRPIGVR